MITLFENDDFVLKSTGHDYDFVGIIETKGYKPLTFFFSEELVPHNEEDEQEWTSWDWDDNIDETQTRLIDVYKGLEPYCESHDGGYDEEQETALELDAQSYFRTRDDRSTGFMAYPKERGWFLAIIKAFCPDKLKEIDWA